MLFRSALVAVGTARLGVIVGRSGLGIRVNQGLVEGLISLERPVSPIGRIQDSALLRRVARGTRVGRRGTRTVSIPNQGFGWATVVAVGCLRARNTGRMTHMDDRCEPALRADNQDRLRMPTASIGMPSMLGAEQPVLDAQALIDRLVLGNAIGVLRIKLAFPAEVFALAARPLIDGYA